MNCWIFRYLDNFILAIRYEYQDRIDRYMDRQTRRIKIGGKVEREIDKLNLDFRYDQNQNMIDRFIDKQTYIKVDRKNDR